MGILSADTSAEAENVQIFLLRRMTCEKKASILKGAVAAGFLIHRKEQLVMTDPFLIAGEVVDALETLGVEYFLGGSIASTLHGEPRFTQDADIIVRLQELHLAQFATILEDRFYLSPPALLDAVRRRTSANLVHFDTTFKVDLMISRERAFEKSRFARKVRLAAGGREFWVASAEDTILVKLECIEWAVKSPIVSGATCSLYFLFIPS